MLASPLANTVPAAAKSLQLCLTLCNPIDGSPPGSPVSGILQARTLEWVAISFSNAWKWSHSVMSNSSWPHELQPTRLLHPRDFPGKSTGVGCHCLLHTLSLAWPKRPSRTASLGPHVLWFHCPPYSLPPLMFLPPGFLTATCRG